MEEESQGSTNRPRFTWQWLLTAVCMSLQDHSV